VDYYPIVQRRSFLLASLASALIGCRALRAPFAPAPLDQHELDTVAAIADTFLPGDDGTPGAHEVNALATLVDPAYGLAPYLGDLVADLDQWCLVTKHAGFLGLSPRDRELVLEQRMGLHGKVVQSWYRAAYEGALALTKLAFFGGLTSSIGTSYLAFPGPSTGYAPGSAAGAWASRDRPRAVERGARSAIQVDGAGAVSAARISVVATTDGELRATLRITAPDGRHHELALHAAGGDATLDDVAVPLTGGAAAGAWQLEIAAASGRGRLELWSLRLRTTLDDMIASAR
jgi:hypothetical protein